VAINVHLWLELLDCTALWHAMVGPNDRLAGVNAAIMYVPQTSAVDVWLLQDVTQVWVKTNGLYLAETNATPCWLQGVTIFCRLFQRQSGPGQTGELVRQGSK
jgi:hypothetical protein